MLSVKCLVLSVFKGGICIPIRPIKMKIIPDLNLSEYFSIFVKTRFMKCSIFTLLILIPIFGISQTITTLAPTQTSTCAGGNIVVQYESTGTFGFPCDFSIELSDEWGDFTAPINIGSVPLNTGVVFGTIPINTTFGFGYRVRVVSSNPYIVGTESPFPPIVITSSAVSAEISTDPSNEICEGDTVTLGVLPNESYVWSNGATTQNINVTESGDYSVTVTNYITGCVVSTPPVTITVNPLPDPALGTSIERCQGEVVILDAGPDNIQYQWNTGSTNQQITVAQTGQYMVYVKDTNNCSIIDTVIVIFRPVPQVNLGQDTSLCENEYILSGPAGMASYNWNNGLSFNPNLAVSQSGTYYLYAENQYHCGNSDTVNILINSLPTIELGNSIASCGNSVILNAGSGYSSYNWNGGQGNSQYFSVNESGNQTVVITDSNDCSASDFVYVHIYELPQVELGIIIDIASDDTLVLDAAAGFQSYLWNNGSTNQTLTIYAADSLTGSYVYSVTVYEANGCYNSDEVIVNISNQNSVSSALMDSFTMYPNPAKEIVRINLPMASGQLNLTNISGEIVLEQIVESESAELNIKDLSPGIYFLKVQTSDGIFVKKLIKE